MEKSRRLLQNVDAVSLVDCFWPPPETVVNLVNTFSIVPRSSLKRKNVDIDTDTLQLLLRLSGNRERIRAVPQGITNRHLAATHQFREIFSFAEIRHGDYVTQPYRFTNIVRTDGHAIDFVFARPQSEESLPDLDMRDFDKYDLDNKFNFWAVDPGEKSVFTAADGEGTDSHQFRHMSKAESYILASCKNTSRKI